MYQVARHMRHMSLCAGCVNRQIFAITKDIYRMKMYVR